MEYKRLTMKADNENTFDNIVNCVVCPNKTEKYECRKDKSNCLKAVINRLAELEDKIENGTLVERPPIKKGDWVYVVHRHKGIRFDDEPYFKKRLVWRYVEKIFLNNDNTFTISTIARTTYGSKSRSILKSTTFNKTWFLTKSEAEEKLKE